MPTIFDTIVSFINSIPKNNSDDDKANKIKDFILNLEFIDKQGIKKPCSDNTKSVLITKTKKYIVDNKLFCNNDKLIILNARELYEKLIKENYQKRKDKNIVDIDIEDVDKIFNLKFNRKMDYNGVYQIDFYSIYAYLLATSGLRTNELWDNEFEIINNNTIKPKRISKNIGDTTPQDAVVSLLVPANEWLKLFASLQEYIKTNKPVYGSSIFSGIKRKLDTINPELSGHSLRKLYVAYHHQILKTDPNKLPSVSTARLLNHKGENASTYYAGAVKITGELKDVINLNAPKPFDKMNVAELKNALKSKNITFTSKMKKNELYKLLTC